MRASHPTRLSVVIPTYNRRPVLSGCLRSVGAQTHPVDEVIVVDDGSTDGTFDWLRDEFPEIKAIRQCNKGVSAARNAGIRHATFEWIALLDSDDRWLPDKIEKQLNALKAHPQSRFCHTEEKWIFQGKMKKMPSHYVKRHGPLFESCLARCAISPSTVVIHRSLLEEVGLFDESLPVCEDYDLWLRITAKHSALLVDEPLVEKHGGSADQLSSTRHLDVYRIQAIVQLLDSAQLNTEYTQLATEALIKKCAIVADGAEKKGKRMEAEKYRSIGEKFRKALEASFP